VSGYLAVIPGQEYFILVGGKGTPGGAGGYNGGGLAGAFAGSGGGATDIRTDEDDIESRILVAGGGGGGNTGCPDAGAGGNGGLQGSAGSSNVGYTPGAGGTAGAGGAGGSLPSEAGSLGIGGDGNYNQAAGGGGGYYGGGSAFGAGGGGGSSYLGTFANTAYTDGENAGNGSVIISFIPNVNCFGGCTNPEAYNYDPNAVYDNGSCMVLNCASGYEGPIEVEFNKNNFEDPTLVYDEIMPDVRISRGIRRAPVNLLYDIPGNNCCGPPTGTQWKWGETGTPGSYTDWRSAVNQSGTNVRNALFFQTQGTPIMSMRLPAHGLYFDIEFINWSERYNNGGGGAMRYIRRLNLEASDCELVPLVTGCMDPAADNYNANANVEDGSCLIPGCTDANACDFDPEATYDDGSCTNVCLGCINPNAFNYNPSANTDDGSCTVLDCQYDGEISVSFTKVAYTNPNLPQNQDIIAPDVKITRDNSRGLINISEEGYHEHPSSPANTQWKWGGYNSPNAFTSWRNAVYQSGFGGPRYSLNGPTPVMTMYLPDYGAYFEVEFDNWTFSNGGGGFSYTRTFLPVESGCTEVPAVQGCTDPGACNFDPAANLLDDSCIQPSCTDPGACNYDATPVCSGGDCFYTVDCDGVCGGDNVEDACGNCVEPGAECISGCTNPNAYNYNPEAVVDDGNCLALICDYQGPLVVDFEKDNYEDYNSVYDEISPDYRLSRGNRRTLFRVGVDAPENCCGYPSNTQWKAGNYDSPNTFTNFRSAAQTGNNLRGNLQNPNFEMTLYIPSEGWYFNINWNTWTNSNNGGGFGYTRTFLVEESGCQLLPYVEGCTDAAACNYDPNASVDDGSCLPAGCNDPAACNFDANANCDDGSCKYLVDACGNCYSIPPGVNFESSVSFEYTGSLQQWVVPAGVSQINIEAFGAQGGGGGLNSLPGGLGARMKGDFTVNPGDVFDILVGEKGQTGSTISDPHGNENGGGGGSFVVLNSGSVPYLIAGGGGGGPATGYGLNCSRDINIAHGQVNETGGTASCLYTGSGGSGGNGGSAVGSYVGAAGAGFYSNGANGGSHCGTALGGTSYLGGGAGGQGNGCYGANSRGGYGGGGGGQLGGPGGGGGYSGGGTAGEWSSYSTYGGGGGSYNAGLNQDNAGGIRSGNGLVIITYIINLECESGCTNPAADNYNPTSTIDDGSCLFAGCMDVAACNFDPGANYSLPETCAYVSDCQGNCGGLAFVDPCGNCNLPENACYGGCTNPDAYNYDPGAGYDDGSCTTLICDYQGDFVVDFTKNNYDDPNSVYDEIDTDYRISRGNRRTLFRVGYDGAEDCCSGYPSNTQWKAGDYDSPYSFTNFRSATTQPGNNLRSNLQNANYEMTLYIPAKGWYFNINWNSWTSSSNGGGFSYTRTFLPEESGCYEVPYVIGCTVSGSCNYNPNATIDDGSCIPGGCQDVAACNYDPGAPCDNGTCEYVVDCSGACGGEATVDNCGNCYDPADFIDYNNYDVEQVTYAYDANYATLPNFEEYTFNNSTVESITLPFTFNFYGVDYNSLNLSNNGFISFTSFSDGCCSGIQFGQNNPGAIQAGIAAAWADYDGTFANAVYSAGDASKFVIGFDAVPRCCGVYGNAATWQIVLYPDNHFEIHLAQIQGNGNVHSTGFQNANGSSGTTIHYGPNLEVSQESWSANYASTAPECDPGCTDPNFCNYDPEAEYNDGSCTNTCLGCTDPNAYNFDAGANTDDGSCLTLICDYQGPIEVNYVKNNYDDPNTFYDEILPGYRLTRNTCNGALWNQGVDGGWNGNGPTGTEWKAGDYNSGYSFTNFRNAHRNQNGFNLKTNLQNPSFVSTMYLPNEGFYFEFDWNSWTSNCSGGGFSYTRRFLIEESGCELVPLVNGCTNPNADNYNPAATYDDGTCVISGCTNNAFCNYNPEANLDDGSCTNVCPGCIYPEANNYDPNATVDDGSCTVFDCDGFVYTGPLEINFNKNDYDDYNSVYDEVLPGIRITRNNTRGLFNLGVDSPPTNCCGPNPSGTQWKRGVFSDPSYQNYTNWRDATYQFGQGPRYSLLGNKVMTMRVTDYNAYFHVTWANWRSNNNGGGGGFGYTREFLPVESGCVEVPLVFGCMNPVADNYNPAANYDDGTCIISGCTDPNFCNFNPEANNNDGSCTNTCPGCTNPEAYNYDANATVEDGSCTVLDCGDYTYTGDLSVTFTKNNYEDYNSVYDEVFPDLRITRNTNRGIFRLGVDPVPNIGGWPGPNGTEWKRGDVNSGYPFTSWRSGAQQYGSIRYNLLNNNLMTMRVPDRGAYFHVTWHSWTQGTGAFSYTREFLPEESGCVEVPLLEGCTDENASNYDAAANVDDGSCQYLGCTDPSFCNYDPNALTDDGSCNNSCPGCTDPNAYNYDSNATIEDGSCTLLICDYQGPLEVTFTKNNYEDYNSVYDEVVPGIRISRGERRVLFNVGVDPANNCCSMYPTGTEWKAGDINSGYSFTSFRNAATQTGGNLRSNMQTVGKQFTMRIPATGLYFDVKFYNWQNSNSGGGFSYTRTLLVEESGCFEIPAVYGCTDPTACNYNSLANADDGSCVPGGCTDPSACNYDPNVSCDNYTCQYIDCAGVCGGASILDACGNCYDPYSINQQFDFSYTGGLQSFEIPSGFSAIRIEAAGGQGGNNSFCSQYLGGKGALMSGDFNVVPGQLVNIIVGQRGFNQNGGNDSNQGASGGGGSFVWISGNSSPLLVAGGGGGASICAGGGNSILSPGMDGVTDNSGTADRSTASPGGINGADGSNIGAGKGWNSVFNDPSGVPGNPSGGYGGGGRESGDHSGGGGGGYSGGGARPYNGGNPQYGSPAAGGGGGGSYNAGINQNNTAGYQSGDGYVRIYLLGEVPVCNAGCTDPNASNFDSNAEFDDGSCIYPGCTNPVAANYDPQANEDDGSCIIVGCCNPQACNYNPAANQDDGSCDFSCFGCTDPVACNYSAVAVFDDGSCILPDGCTDPLACNYDINALCDDGTCVYPGCTDAAACNYVADAGCEDGSCTYPGCTTPGACNYNPLAGCDDGTCTYPGCTTAGACNYNPLAGCDDGTCTYPGCTTAGACNYNPLAGCDDGSCVYPGCTVAGACNYNPAAGCDDGTCTYPGCTNAGACNYNAAAGCDDGSCVYPGCTDPLACNYDQSAGCDNGSCDFSCYGCIDPLACNYEQGATLDDGSCDYSCYGCTDCTACNYSESATIDDGTCDYASCTGCTYPEALNYNAAATVDDGSCIYEPVNPNGCMDSGACNYDVRATVDDGTCDYSCLGCTYPGAANYNANATKDDGNCIFEGCTDPGACNYSVIANADDNSCDYTCNCPEDINGDGNINTADLLDLLSVFGQNCN
jgi:hypothetical protein